MGFHSEKTLPTCHNAVVLSSILILFLRMSRRWIVRGVVEWLRECCHDSEGTWDTSTRRGNEIKGISRTRRGHNIQNRIKTKQRRMYAPSTPAHKHLSAGWAPRAGYRKAQRMQLDPRRDPSPQMTPSRTCGPGGPLPKASAPMSTNLMELMICETTM